MGRFGVIIGHFRVKMGHFGVNKSFQGQKVPFRVNLGHFLPFPAIFHHFHQFCKPPFHATKHLLRGRPNLPPREPKRKIFLAHNNRAHPNNGHRITISISIHFQVQCLRGEIQRNRGSQSSKHRARMPQRLPINVAWVFFPRAHFRRRRRRRSRHDEPGILSRRLQSHAIY